MNPPVASSPLSRFRSSATTLEAPTDTSKGTHPCSVRQSCTAASNSNARPHDEPEAALRQPSFAAKRRTGAIEGSKIRTGRGHEKYCPTGTVPWTPTQEKTKHADPSMQHETGPINKRSSAHAHTLREQGRQGASATDGWCVFQGAARQPSHTYESWRRPDIELGSSPVKKFELRSNSLHPEANHNTEEAYNKKTYHWQITSPFTPSKPHMQSSISTRLIKNPVPQRTGMGSRENKGRQARN
jgi:hypothetical protein